MKLRWERIFTLVFLVVIATFAFLLLSLLQQTVVSAPADFSSVSFCDRFDKTPSNKMGLGLTLEYNIIQDTNVSDCYDAESISNNWNSDKNGDAETATFPQINVYARLAKVPIIVYYNVSNAQDSSSGITNEKLAKQFEAIKRAGLTPVSMDMLVKHLGTGMPLPEKPILLSFDGGYAGHYKYVYSLLKQYGYPAIFSVYINALEGKIDRLNWSELKEMANNPLVTIANNSLSHPEDLTSLSEAHLKEEVLTSKKNLEQRLGKSVLYFNYPNSKLDERVKNWVIKSGYEAALISNELKPEFAGQSTDILEIERFDQDHLKDLLSIVWGGMALPTKVQAFDFTSIPRQEIYLIDNKKIIMAIGGKPGTIHAPVRTSVVKIIQDTDAVAALDGTFFSMKTLNTNEMIGPVLSQNEKVFIPGNSWDIQKITGRPLVLISPKWVKFIPFDPNIHNSFSGILNESADDSTVTDAFVAGAWLVKNSRPQPAETFEATHLYAFDVPRNRAFWGINQAGQPIIGVTKDNLDSVALGKILVKLGLKDVVMVDSGASADLVYYGKSQVVYKPRPVPHVVAIFPPDTGIQNIGVLQFPCFDQDQDCINLTN